MGRRRRIDPDDLLDSTQAAEIMGLAGSGAFAVYTARHDDFPSPIVERGRYCKLYLRQDIEAFMKRHPRMGRKARKPVDE